jgi:hypothetical protein
MDTAISREIYLDNEDYRKNSTVPSDGNLNTSAETDKTEITYLEEKSEILLNSYIHELLLKSSTYAKLTKRFNNATYVEKFEKFKRLLEKDFIPKTKKFKIYK